MNDLNTFRTIMTTYEYITDDDITDDEIDDDDITDDEIDDDDITDDEIDDEFIPLTSNVKISTHLIEPLLLCTESADELGQYSECPICFEEDINILYINTTYCQHSFCHSCIMKHLRVKNDCPLCRSTVRTLQVRQSEHYDEVMKAFGTININTPLRIYIVE